MTNRQ
jgi:hypothetical protein